MSPKKESDNNKSVDEKFSMNTLKNFESKNKNLKAQSKSSKPFGLAALSKEQSVNQKVSISQNQNPNQSKSSASTIGLSKNEQNNLKNSEKIKSEKQKMTEIAGNDELQFTSAKSHAKNIVAIFLVLVLSVFALGSVIIAGNFSSGTVITANVTNTRIVQAKLSALGYYDKEIDGIFDKDTIDAVKSYQADKNLAVTGNLDSATTAALGVTDNAQANSDLYLLAKLIYSEARGEIYQGQVAVGAVVLNRVADAGFPNTLQGVIYQPWAFTALHDGQFSLEPNSTAYSAAQDAMNGWDPTYGCLYYYNPRTATSSWIFSRTIAVTIGNHVFCY
jgi:N-acetylmuramoyl-L-alanine amidase